jgi:hypothetical protein
MELAVGAVLDLDKKMISRLEFLIMAYRLWIVEGWANPLQFQDNIFENKI